MAYAHRFIDGAPCSLPRGKAICVGLNYADHVQEMHSQRTAEPMLFIKPPTALVALASPLMIPAGLGSVHYETELALLIGAPLTGCGEQDVLPAIAGVGVALDLTLRDLQNELKQAGQPWEKAKGWDGACALSPFLKPGQVGDLQNLRLRLESNGERRQDGNTRQMITPVVPLISYMTRFFTLEPGDVVLTGTPQGVGPLTPGDRLVVELADLIRLEVSEVRARDVT